tara:strand:+ start:38 stop:376 length:339 start_codon:yes stop_codon:yes gene_type:complete
MPLIHLRTSHEINLDNKEVMSDLSKLVSDLTNKPESYVMCILETNMNMYFSGNANPSCFIDIKSIGSLEPKIISKAICEYISNKLLIQKNRIYINFEDVRPSNWGHNATTFA